MAKRTIESKNWSAEMANMSHRIEIALYMSSKTPVFLQITLSFQYFQHFWMISDMIISDVLFDLNNANSSPTRGIGVG